MKSSSFSSVSGTISSPLRYLSTLSAALLPPAQALIKASGLVTTSPAAKIPFLEVMQDSVSITIVFFLVTSTPSTPSRTLKSIAWPIAGTTISHSRKNSLPSIGIGLLLPDSSGSPNCILINSIPTTFPSFPTIFVGLVKYINFTPSSSASSISSIFAGISLFVLL